MACCMGLERPAVIVVELAEEAKEATVPDEEVEVPEDVDNGAGGVEGADSDPATDCSR